MNYTFLFLLVAVATAQPIKRLYSANDDHTDCMWSANEAKYDTAFVHMLDYYLHQIDSTARRPGKNNPPDFQARFNCDGSYWLRVYQKFRTPAQFNRLIAAIRSGHSGSPLNTLVSCYGAQPTGAILRGMYYAGQLERAYELRFTLAEAMENNILPLGLSSLRAGSGARYSWKGIGGYGSRMTYKYRANCRKQLYRYTGLDSCSVLHSADFEPVAAMKFSLKHQNPFVTGAVTGSQDTYPGQSFSLLNTSDPNRSEITADAVLLWSLKPSEEGIDKGLIIRFWNVANKPATPTLTLTLPIRQAWQTTHSVSTLVAHGLP